MPDDRGGARIGLGLAALARAELPWN